MKFRTVDSAFGGAHSPLRLALLAGFCLVFHQAFGAALAQSQKPASEPTIDQLTNAVRGILQRRTFKSQDADQAGQFLKTNPDLLKSYDAAGATLLHWAAGAGDEGKLALLLTQGLAVDAKDRRGLTPLHWAASSGQRKTAELLLARGANVGARDQHGAAPLHWATLHGYEEVAGVLLAHGADANARDAYGQTPLAQTAHSGNLFLARFLLNHGADVNATNRLGDSPLHAAAGAGNKPLVQLLVEQGARIDARQARGETPLHRAALAGSGEVAELLIRRGAQIDARQVEGATPLHVAALMGHKAVAELLLARNAEVDARATNGATPLHMTIQQLDRMDAVSRSAARLAQISGLPQDTNYVSAAIPPMGKDHADVAALLIEHGANIDAPGEAGHTPLQYAARHGNRPIAELLIAHHANTETPDKFGFSPFHAAVDHGHLEMAALFLAHNANVNARTADQWAATPLHLAARAEFTTPNRYRDVAQLLLARGADVNATNAMGETPLHDAIRFGHGAVAELLLAHKANVEARDKDGLTSLHWAAWNGQLEMARSLLAFKADVNARTPDGSTPLHYAAGKGFKAMIELLLANHADLRSENARGDTPLILALALRHTEVADLLQRQLQLTQSLEKRPVAGADVAVVSRVEHLGDPERIKFTGLRTFTPQAIRNALIQDPDYLLAGHPVAPMEEYLSSLQRLIRAGYESLGFPNVRVAAAPDDPRENVVVTVNEGQRYLKGAINVIGARSVPVDQLIRRLTEPYPPTQTAGPRNPAPLGTAQKQSGITGSFKFGEMNDLPGPNEKRLDKTGKEVKPTPPAWVKGEPASFSQQAVSGLNSVVTNVLADLGYLFPKLEVKIGPMPETQTAMLRIEILDEGPKDTIEEIEIVGNKKNSREGILNYLKLARGMPVDDQLITRTELSLWRSARFLTHSVSVQRLEADPTKLKIKLDLAEYDKAPALTENLTTEEQALVKLCDWLSGFTARDEDLKVSIASLPWEALKDTQLNFILAPKTGWFVSVGNRKSTGATKVHSALTATSQKLTWFSPQQGKKLSVPMSRGQVVAFINLTANSQSDPETLFHLEIGAGVNSNFQAAQASAVVETLFAPVAFLDEVHRTNVNAGWKGGILLLTNDENVLEVDAASGRPLKLEFFNKRESLASARIEKGLFAAASKELETPGADLAEAYDARKPVSSMATFVIEELLRIPSLTLSMSWLPQGSTPEQRDQAANALRRIFQQPVLAPLDELALRMGRTETNEFSIPVDPHQVVEQGTGALIANAAAWVFRQCNELFPKQSWPWTVAHEAVFVLRGQAKYTDLELTRLYNSKEMGPIGFLAIAKLLARIQSPAARVFAERGLTVLLTDDFRNDYRLLLDANSPLSQSFIRAVESLKTLRDEDVDALAAVLPKTTGDLLRTVSTLLRRSEGQSSHDAIAQALDRFWEQSLRAQVQSALGALLRPSPPKSKNTSARP